MPTKLWGFEPPISKDHRFSPNLMRLQFLTERNLISHDVITKPSQFIAQRLRGKARVSLGHFAVIITSEMLIVSA